MYNDKMCDKAHNLIEKNNETLLFSVMYDTGADKLIIEIRQSTSGNIGVLYHFAIGLGRNETSFIHNLLSSNRYKKKFANFDEAIEKFDYKPYIHKTEMSDYDFSYVMDVLNRNPKPSFRGNHGGYDGHDIIFHNRVACEATYRYWVYPPKGYEYLKDIVNVLCRYIPEPYCEWIYLE